VLHYHLRYFLIAIFLYIPLNRSFDFFPFGEYQTRRAVFFRRERSLSSFESLNSLCNCLWGLLLPPECLNYFALNLRICHTLFCCFTHFLRVPSVIKFFKKRSFHRIERIQYESRGCFFMGIPTINTKFSLGKLSVPDWLEEPDTRST
jgi:hypothetical protein